MHVENEVLQQQLKEAQEMNVYYIGKITSLEQQLKNSQFLSVASSFSKFSKEEFKELALKIHEDHKNLFVQLFEGLNDIHETYNYFEIPYDVLYDHNQIRNEETKDIEDVLDWKKFIKYKPKNVLVLDKIKIIRINISLDY